MKKRAWFERATPRNGGVRIVLSVVLAMLCASRLLGGAGTLTWIGPASGGSWDDSANWSSDYSAGTFSDWLTGSGYSTTFNFSSLADGAAVTTSKAKLRIGGIVLPSSSGTWTFTGASSATAVFGTDINTPLEVSVPSGGKVVWRIKVPLDTSNATDCGFNLRGGGSFCIDAEFRPYSKKKQIRAYDGTIIIGANMPSTYSGGLNWAGISLINDKGKLALERDTYLGMLWSTPGYSQNTVNLNGHTLYLQREECSLAGTVQGGGAIEFRSGLKLTVDEPLSGNAFYHASRGFVTNKVAFPSGSVIGASMGGQIVLKGNQTVAGLCGTGMTAQVAVPAASMLTVAPASGKRYEYQGRLTGDGGLALNGAAGSALTLSGYSAYAGATAVNGGTLVAAGTPVDCAFHLPFDGHDDKSHLAEQISGTAVLTGANGIPLSLSTAPDGLFGKAVRFSNADCWRIKVAGLNRYGLGQSISVSAWVKPTSLGAAGNGCVFNAGTGWDSDSMSHDLIWLHFGNDPAKRTFVATPGLSGVLPGGATFDDGDWHHVCFTQGGRSRKLYLDGVLVASVQTAADMSTTWGDAFIGALAGATTSANTTAYDGDLDEFMIANREWTAEEVAEVARARPPRRVVASRANDLPQPLAHWAFDDASDIGKDSSGNGHTLVVAAGSPSVVGTQPGARGKCLNLSGSAALRLDSFAADLPGGKSSFTLAVRFVQKTTPLDSAIVGWGDFSTANRFFCTGVYQDPRVNFVSWNQPTGASFADKSGPLSYTGNDAHNWDTYVYVKHANSTVRVYREGVLLTSTTWDVSSIDILRQDFYVGYRPSNGKYFNGVIDDIRIYGEALSEREVSLLTLDMKTVEPFASTLPSTTDMSVSSGAAVQFNGSAQAVRSLSGTGEIVIPPYSELTVSHGGTFSGALKGRGVLCLAGGVTTLSGDMSEWNGTILLDGGRLVLSGAAAGADVVLAKNAVWTSDKDGTGFPVVTGAGNIELPETLTLSFPDGLRSSCANFVLASGTSVVAPSSFAGWTLDAPSTSATGIRCQVNGGVVSVRVLGLGGMKIIFR